MESSSAVTRVSAGGVVYRLKNVDHDKKSVQIALILVAPKLRWQLPKGTVDQGEAIDRTALREVREETGIEAELLGQLKRIEYWFNSFNGSERIRYHKYVYFFLMRYLSGDVTDHDHEVVEARWFDIEQALDMLAFESEREVVQIAREKILAGNL